MPDKRKFHVFLNRLKDEIPSDISLIESIQKKFEEDIESISDKDKKALKQFPTQFIKRIQQEDMGWTTQLHSWAEQSIPEILKLDPMILAFKNAYGDSILMSLVAGATGLYTEEVNHELISDILDTDFTYEDVEKDEEDNDVIIEKNALDEVDVNDQNPIDFLIDFAYATGDYDGMQPDENIQQLLQQFAIDFQESYEQAQAEAEYAESLDGEEYEEEVVEEDYESDEEIVSDEFDEGDEDDFIDAFDGEEADETEERQPLEEADDEFGSVDGYGKFNY